jgi:hypothetical protein
MVYLWLEIQKMKTALFKILSFETLIPANFFFFFDSLSNLKRHGDLFFFVNQKEYPIAKDFIKTFFFWGWSINKLSFTRELLETFFGLVRTIFQATATTWTPRPQPRV